VYEVVRKDIGQLGALKVLVPHDNNPHLLNRFQNQARAVSALHHPNIPQVLDLGLLADGTAFLVVTLLHGQTLETLLAEKALPFSQALSIAEDVAAALEAAHKKNIVHRDVKPSNLMLIADDTHPHGERALVLDFGIAKLLGSERLTLTGHFVGTPLYMAPEQGVRAQDVDGRADVYSLGVVLYQMLCRRVPFRCGRGDGPFVILAEKAQPPIPIETRVPQLPSDLCALVNAMVQPDRTARPTMTDVRAVLRGFKHRAWPKEEVQVFGQDAVCSEKGPLDYDDEGPKTPDPVDLDASPLLQTGTRALLAGPSPDSLSELPTRAMSVPPLLSGPEDSTVRPPPSDRKAERHASPSAPTFRPVAQRNQRKAIRWAVFALAVFSLLLWVSFGPGLVRKSSGPTDSGRAGLPESVPSPKGERPSTAEPGAKAGPEATSPADLATDSPKDLGSSLPLPKSPARREPVKPGCVTAIGIAPNVQQRVAQAFRDVNIDLSGQEQVVFAYTRGRPRFLAVPERLDAGQKELLLTSLQGWLKDTSPSAEITVSCGAR
jgi:serine/threonine-protein kinase